MNQLKEENTTYFKLQGGSFACYIPHTTKACAVAFAEGLRNAMNASGKFIEKITVSLGVVCFDEIRNKDISINEPAEVYITQQCCA